MKVVSRFTRLSEKLHKVYSRTSSEIQKKLAKHNIYGYFKALLIGFLGAIYWLWDKFIKNFSKSSLKTLSHIRQETSQKYTSNHYCKYQPKWFEWKQ